MAKERAKMIRQTDINDIAACSTALWTTFKDICSVISEIPEREKAIDMAFVIMRDKVKEYKDTQLYGYSVGYAHDLLNEIERMLYPGKVKKTNYQDVKYMEYAAFCEYLKDPNPGDLITVTQGDRNMARIKVRTVING